MVTALKRLGALVAKRRADKRLSQRELADLAGLSHTTVRRLEGGDLLYPREETVLAICKVLGIRWSTAYPLLQAARGVDPLVTLAEQVPTDLRWLADVVLRAMIDGPPRNAD